MRDVCMPRFPTLAARRLQGCENKSRDPYLNAKRRRSRPARRDLFPGAISRGGNNPRDSMPFVRTLVAIVPAFTCIFRERDEGKTAATNSGNDGGSNRDDHRRIARDRQRERERERETHTHTHTHTHTQTTNIELRKAITDNGPGGAQPRRRCELVGGGRRRRKRGRE